MDAVRNPDPIPEEPMTSTTPTSRIPMLLAAAAVCALALSGCGAPAQKPAAAPAGPVANVTTSTTDGTRTARPDAAPISGTLEVGQTATVGDLRVTLTGIEPSGEWEGRPVLQATVTYENRGTQAVKFDQAQWAVSTLNGAPSSKLAPSDKPTLGSGDLAPGLKKVGLIPFSCPGRVRKVIFQPAGGTPVIWATVQP
jgi:hypothetical protein